MKPTRERAIAALRAVLDECDHAETPSPISDYEIGRKYVAGRIRKTITDILQAEP